MSTDIENSAVEVPVLSNSSVNSFMTCPYKYKLSKIDGWQTKWENSSDALKIGSWVDAKLTGEPDPSTNNDDDSLWKAKAQAMLRGIKDLDPIDMDVYDQQKQITLDLHDIKVRGFADFMAKDLSHFIDLKCSSRPDHYLNKYWIHDQMGTYFLYSDKLKYVEMYVMRVPLLIRKEELSEYRQRCYDDMCKRPDFYIHRVKFYRTEFDLEELERRYQWIGMQIANCIRSKYWYQNKTQCLSKWKCDFMNICDSGGISPRLYEQRSERL